MSNLTKTGRPRIGGQAVLEGVMMNGEKHYAVSVRKTDGTISSEIFDSHSLTNKGGIWKLPIIRGIIRFVESMIIGVKTLEYSADIFIEDETGTEKKTLQEEGKETEACKEKKGEEAAEPKKTFAFWEKHGEDITMAFTLLLSFALALGLFVFLPTFLVKLLYTYVIRSEHHYLMGLLEGVVKMIVFVLYLWLVSKMKDIHRTFEYHGAEHKVIQTFEDAVPLTVENVRQRSRFNKRCGTSFLFLVLFISILIFSFIQITDLVPRLLAHLALIPFIGGLSYEVQRASAKNDSKFLDLMVKPGLWIQRITTAEPDDEEIMVAIASVVKVMEVEHPEFLDAPEEEAERS